MKTFPAVLLVLAIAGAAVAVSRPPAVTAGAARPLKTVQDCSQLGDSIMALIGKGQADEVYNLVEKHHAGELGKEQVLKSVEQSKAFVEVAGQMTGIELISKRNVGSSILILRYLKKHEKGGMLWTLRFYHPKDQWLLEGVQMLGRVSLGELVEAIDEIEPNRGDR